MPQVVEILLGVFFRLGMLKYVIFLFTRKIFCDILNVDSMKKYSIYYLGDITWRQGKRKERDEGRK